MFLYSYIVIYKNLNRLIWETKETMPENTVISGIFAVSRFVSARGLHNAGKPGDRCPGNKPFPIRQLLRTPGGKLCGHTAAANHVSVPKCVPMSVFPYTRVYVCMRACPLYNIYSVCFRWFFIGTAGTEGRKPPYCKGFQLCLSVCTCL